MNLRYLVTSKSVTLEEVKEYQECEGGTLAQCHAKLTNYQTRLQFDHPLYGWTDVPTVHMEDGKELTK